MLIKHLKKMREERKKLKLDFERAEKNASISRKEHKKSMEEMEKEFNRHREDTMKRMKSFELKD